MTSSNGNIFRVTGPLCGEFTGHRCILITKASDAELWYFLWSAPEQMVVLTNAGDLRRRRAHYDVIAMFDTPMFLARHVFVIYGVQGNIKLLSIISILKSNIHACRKNICASYALPPTTRLLNHIGHPGVCLISNGCLQRCVTARPHDTENREFSKCQLCRHWR